MNYRIVINCEHAGNRIPQPYLFLFDENQSILDTHRGYDPGALDIALALSEKIQAPLFHTQESRLLIDCNRSLHNPSVFSAFTKLLSQDERQKIIDSYYHPFRYSVLKTIVEAIQLNQTILHLSIHTFTPVLDGNVRNADIGLLYDPKREREKKFCQKWKTEFLKIDPKLRVRLNYPYRGKADGHTTALRRQFSEEHYLGIELEVNHLWYFQSIEKWERLMRGIVGTFQLVLE